MLAAAVVLTFFIRGAGYKTGTVVQNGAVQGTQTKRLCKLTYRHIKFLYICFKSFDWTPGRVPR